MAGEHLFGLTPEARYYIYQAAKAVVDELRKENCPFPCPRMEAVETAVFGRTETGVVGLDMQVRENTASLASLRRLGWVLLGACVSALALGVVEIVVALLTHPH